MSKVFIFKMTSGEEVIGSIDDDTFLFGSDSFIINKPRSVHMIQTQKGISLQLMPFIQVDPDATVEISTTDMLIKPIPANNDVSTAYLRDTSNLELPPSAAGSILHS